MVHTEQVHCISYENVVQIVSPALLDLIPPTQWEE